MYSQGGEIGIYVCFKWEVFSVDMLLFSSICFDDVVCDECNEQLSDIDYMMQ